MRALYITDGFIRHPWSFYRTATGCFKLSPILPHTRYVPRCHNARGPEALTVCGSARNPLRSSLPLGETTLNLGCGFGGLAQFGEEFLAVGVEVLDKGPEVFFADVLLQFNIGLPKV